ncbi:MAG: hypothetical protein ACM3UR_10185 [Bacteroidota bacterium]|jgi:chromosome segregation ATPase|nr:hypothetical protein [Ignavibacteria bacterium]HEX2960662.1 hypothetical protein [Ignavibacteriales bacterium]MCU7497256.1 hypothetical protein [Ignavibacteria bacterium]MCU7498178.1 hypothetical protein [Ignavibacteria bacterium]MCU7503201.1 hypothetical protein [Ignavibacteria bacterium]
MTKSKGLVVTMLLTAGMIGFAGCSGVSDEEMAQLESLRQEVNTLNSDVTSLRSERTRLEREIGEKNAKLEQCARDKEETKSNLEKLPK